MTIGSSITLFYDGQRMPTSSPQSSPNNPNRRPRLWVTGARGFLGRYLVDVFRETPFRWRVVPVTRTLLDLTDPGEVREFFQRQPPDVIIHGAALSDTGQCERDPELSRAINVEATRRLAELAREARLVFLSTDLVFDGSKGNYTEEDSPHPLHVYGRHKLEAEECVLQHPRHLVVRTSLNAGVSHAGNRSFNEQMKAAWSAGRTLTLFQDEFRNPIAAEVTARAIRHLVEHDLTGRFHVAGRERLSRWEMGVICRDHYGAPPSGIRAGSLRDHDGPRRAPDTTLHCRKAQRLLPFPLLGFREWLASHADLGALNAEARA